MPVRSSCRLAVPAGRAETRGRSDRSCARGCVACAAGRARCGRQTGGAHLVLCGHRLWPDANSGQSVHGRELDQLGGQGERLCEVENAGGTCGLGFHWQPGRSAGTGGRQSGRDFWAGPGAGSFDLDGLHQALAGRRDAGSAAHGVRCGRRAGRGGSASARHDQCRRQGGAVPRHQRRFHDDAGDRTNVEIAAGQRCVARYDENAADWLVRTSDCSTGKRLRS